MEKGWMSDGERPGTSGTPETRGTKRRRASFSHYHQPSTKQARPEAVEASTHWDVERDTRVSPVGKTLNFGNGLVTKQGWKITTSAQDKVEPLEFVRRLEAILKHGLEKIWKDFDPEEIGQVIIRNPSLYSEYTSTKCQRFGSLSVDDVMARFMEAKNSEDAKRGDDDDDEGGIRLQDTEFHFVRVRRETHAGALRKNRQMGRRQQSMDKFLLNKKSLVDPMAQKGMSKKCDNWCLVMACVLGRHRADNPNADSKVYKDFHKRTGELARLSAGLIRAAGLSETGPHRLSDLGRIQQVLGDDYQISCYTSRDKPVSSGVDAAPKHINIFIRGGDNEEPVGHAYLMSSMTGFFASEQKSATFCELCKNIYSKERSHKCSKSSCILCGHIKCLNTKLTRKLEQNREECPDCRLGFWSLQCLTAHTKYDKDTCKATKKCQICGRLNRCQNGCSLIYCGSCKENTTFDHTCYMKTPGKRSRGKSGKQRWYGDIESREEEDGRHQPNLLILKNAGNDKTKIYRGDDCILDFIKDTHGEESIYKNSYIVFHNMGGYDGHFVFHAAMEMELKPKILRRGTKFLSLELPNDIVLRDSYLFVPSALAKFSGIFELEKGKGFFPHRLNRPKYLAEELYEEGGLRFPPKAIFHPEEMKNKERREFLVWWEEESARYAADPTLRYVVWDQLEKYCLQDVNVLMQGFETFLQGLEKQHPGVDVLANVTAPSLCNNVFRAEDMEEDSIALLPPAGFKPNGEGYSLDELAWLHWQKKQRKLVELRHNRNFNSMNIGGKEVDGVGWDKEGRMYVFEYNGCYYHGCKKESVCRIARQTWTRARVELSKGNPREAEDLEHKYLKTKHKMNMLTRLGALSNSPYGQFTLVSISEHQFKAQMKSNESMRKRVADFKNSLYNPSQERRLAHKRLKAAIHNKARWSKTDDQPKEKNQEETRTKREADKKMSLSLEESFFGGRTNAIMHCVEAGEGEEIGYADFTSLYPAVNACTREGEEYPKGYPNILLGIEVQEHFDISLTKAIRDKDLFGVLHCEVYPPSRLRHAVIPFRANGKLLFPLCRTCATEENQESCKHSREERKLTIHLPTPEIRKALEMGYRLGRVFEAWQWSREKRSARLLRGYVVKHYMEKEYASGFPPGVVSEEEKQAHAELCSNTVFGEPVDVKLFQKNSGKRALHKGMLNQFWGFFGKREDSTTYDTLTDGSEVERRIFDPNRETTFVDLSPNGTFVILGTKPLKEPAGKNSSRLLASFTTAMARVRLYEVLQEHSEDIIYMDTDSVFYLKRAGKRGPWTPGTLGELKDEVAAAYPPGSRIVLFVSLGPKSYIYVVADAQGKVIDQQIRMKGITAQGCSTLTSQQLQQVVQERKKLFVKQTSFHKDIIKRTVKTKTSDKIIRFSSTKRRFLQGSPRLDTVPYGYIDEMR